ncbi:TIGR03943 family putative permease subunit [Pseudalkalibacillus berkeleyi]|uniref:TIGR03943 family protein n=1 Tax=Pseudalkalibacillus berkeleyi TaxID=1069813 RepID=A0ABS9GXN8_9BACL|nr:TIGR03943 family protein [Pseudalkalibacillus berkeleyi]MCF6136353.1 TIGR03943 family protein [Pseudalkalibacillus berkeleyi]
MNNQFYINLRAIILFGFAFLLCSFIYSGKIQYYIAPQMMKFIYFAAGTFFVLGVVQMFRSEDSEEHCLCGHDHADTSKPFMRFSVYFLFLLPLLTGFVFPDKVLDSAMAEKKGVSLTGTVGMKASASKSDKPLEKTQSDSDTPNADAYLEDPEKYMEELDEKYSDDSPDTESDFDYDEYYLEIADKYEDKERIKITDDNYADLVDSITIFLDRFEGKEIEVKGFVYRENGMEQNQLVVARFLMSCCSADTSVIGMMATGSDLDQIDDDSWVKVTGTISHTTYEENRIPLIEVKEVDKIKKPDTPYVYQDLGFFK